MNVEYAFLCDYADPSNKLTAVGIGIDSIYVPLVEPLQNSRRLQRSLNVAPQKGLDLLGPHPGERVRSGSPPPLALLLRRQPASLPRPRRPHAHTRCCCRPLLTLAFH